MGRIIGRRVQKVNCPEEPGAGILPAGICEGGAGQPASLPRQPEHGAKTGRGEMQGHLPVVVHKGVGT